MKLTKAGQGERGNRPKHRINAKDREAQRYPEGVSEEMSPLFDFSINPWMLVRDALRLMTVVHLAVKYSGMDREAGEYTILDAACGYGEVFTLLQSYRKAKGVRTEYIGIDLDLDKLAIAKELRRTIDVRPMNMVNFGLELEKEFDIIISSESLEHLEQRDGLKFLYQVYTWLKIGGTFVLTFTTPYKKRDNPYHLREWEMHEVIEELEDIGFTILDSFFLHTHSREWPHKGELRYDRLPNQITTAVTPALESLAAGPTAIIIATIEGA